MSYRQFKTLSDVEKHGHEIDGKTLVARLKEAQKAQREKHPSAPTTGKRFYASLRAKYAAADNPYNALRCTSATLPLADDLKRAMIALHQKVPNKQPLLDWMQLCTVVPNQRDLQGT